MDVNEKDWKLFRKYLPDWQENYMESTRGVFYQAEVNHEMAYGACEA